MPSDYSIKKKCKFCQKVFFAYIYNIKKGFGKYCSKKCSNRGNNLGFKKGHISFLTEESRKKISLALKGRVVSVITREKISKANIGKEISKEHRKKLSEAHKGTKKPWVKGFPEGHTINLGRILPKKGKYINCLNCGKNFYVTKEQLNKRRHCSRICLFNSSEWRANISKRNKGKTLSEETKEKLSLALRGPKSSLWMGGVGLVSKNLRQRPQYMQWRRKIIRRDGYKCIQCDSEKKLTVDHIIPVVENPDLIFEISNGRTLCWDCHNQVTIKWRKSRRLQNLQKK